MKQRKIPMRMCVVTKDKLPKGELIRIVKTEEGVIVDPTGKKNGRGAYLKKDLEVFEKAKKTKVLNKILETEVNEEVFESLKQTLN
ncbi:MAG: YlxR family protein [Bacilli bacterium]|nr:YlxR family protein [Bacilli bacterium]